MNIISLQGKRASGKDTAALFIKFLLSTPKFLHNYKIAKLLQFRWFTRWKIIKYANPLKQALSVILNIPIERFEDREFKEYFYFNFQTYTLFDSRSLQPNAIDDTQFNEELSKNNLNLALQYNLSIRQILMFFGTDIMRRFFGDKLWIYATLNTNEKSIIISDQRFIIEYETVKNKNGVTIHITRSQEGTSNHSSESQLIELYKKHHFQYHINNNGSLEDLFNECKKFVYYYERN